MDLLSFSGSLLCLWLPSLTDLPKGARSRASGFGLRDAFRPGPCVVNVMGHALHSCRWSGCGRGSASCSPADLGKTAPSAALVNSISNSLPFPFNILTFAE